MNANALLAQFSEQQVAAFFLVLARVTPAVHPRAAVLEQDASRPARARSSRSASRSASCRSSSTAQIDLDPLAFGLLILKEVVVGLAFAYALAAMFAALQAAGTLLDTLIGFSFGAIVDPVTGTQSAVIQQMYSLFGVAIFIAIGGDAWVIKGLGPHLRRGPDARHAGHRLDGAGRAGRVLGHLRRAPS